MKKKPKITKTVIEEVADNNDLINGIFSKRLAIANTILYFGVVAYCLGIYTATGNLPVEVVGFLHMQSSPKCGENLHSCHDHILDACVQIMRYPSLNYQRSFPKLQSEFYFYRYILLNNRSCWYLINKSIYCYRTQY